MLFNTDYIYIRSGSSTDSCEYTLQNNIDGYMPKN